MSIKKNIKALKQEFFESHRLMNVDEDQKKEKEIIKVTPSQLYKYIGTQKMTKVSDYNRISNKAAPLLEELLSQERDENQRRIHNGEAKISHIQLRDIHNYQSVKTRISTYFVMYVLPALYILKASKMSSMSYAKYLFFIPLISAFPTINDGIRQYVIRKNAVLMLFCLDKYYKDNSDFYSKYTKFMNENKLVFREREIEIEKKLNL